MSLCVRPLTLREANALVSRWHRHHKPVVGQKFSIGCESNGEFVGAVIVSRPVSRGCDFRRVAEVSRLVTNGTKNACSLLYSAAARACAAMGYERIQTYILESEPGTSLRAAGWRFDRMTAGGDWNSSHAYRARGRRTDQPMGPKQCWVKDL